MHKCPTNLTDKQWQVIKICWTPKKDSENLPKYWSSWDVVLFQHTQSAGNYFDEVLPHVLRKEWQPYEHLPFTEGIVEFTEDILNDFLLHSENSLIYTR